jgi:hypothetical protein
MGLDSFVAELFERGQVCVAVENAPSRVELERAGELIAEFERSYRLDLPGEPPPLSLAAAIWGALIPLSVLRAFFVFFVVKAWHAGYKPRLLLEPIDDGIGRRVEPSHRALPKFVDVRIIPMFSGKERME